MKPKANRKVQEGSRSEADKLEEKLSHPNAATIESATLSGAIAGAAVGAFAGPAGALAGGLVGTALGAMTAVAMDEEDHRHSKHDAELDEEIGVNGGPMGAASPDAPPARIGAFSSGSAGVSRPSRPPSEGPMQDLDED